MTDVQPLSEAEEAVSIDIDNLPPLPPLVHDRVLCVHTPIGNAIYEAQKAQS